MYPPKNIIDAATDWLACKYMVLPLEIVSTWTLPAKHIVVLPAEDELINEFVNVVLTDGAIIFRDIFIIETWKLYHQVENNIIGSISSSNRITTKINPSICNT